VSLVDVEKYWEEKISAKYKKTNTKSTKRAGQSVGLRDGQDYKK